MSEVRIQKQQLIAQSYKLLNAQRYQQAISLLSQLLRNEKKNQDALNLITICFINLKNYKEAENALKTAEHLLGTPPWLIRNKALLARHRGDTQGEYKSLLKLFTLAVENSKESERLIRLSCELGLFNQAFITIDAIKHRAYCTDSFLDGLNVLAFKAIQKYDVALEISESLQRGQDQNISIRHQHGVLLRLNGRAKEAIAILEPLSRQSNHFAVFHNLGNAYSDLGETSNALRYYNAALKRNPHYIDTHTNIAKLRWESGDKVNFTASFEQLLPSIAAPLLFSYINTLVGAKFFDKALKTLAQYSQFASYPKWWELKAASYRNQGQFLQAEEAYAELSGKFTLTSAQRLDIAANLIELAKPESAIIVIKQVLGIEPDNQLAIAYLHTARRAAGSDSFNVGDYVNEYFLESNTPEDEKVNFNRALADYLRTQHKAVEQPMTQTLEKGTQTRGHLFSSDHPLIKRLKASVDAAVLTFIDEQNLDRDRLVNASGKPNYVGSWSVRLTGQGFHHNHIHSHGRISGVVYIHLPRECHDIQRQEGWLKLGQSHSFQPSKLPPDLVIQPELMKCVLFRSFLWHGTTPFTQSDERLTVAFDVGEYGIDLNK